MAGTMADRGTHPRRPFQCCPTENFLKHGFGLIVQVMRQENALCPVLLHGRLQQSATQVPGILLEIPGAVRRPFPTFRFPEDLARNVMFVAKPADQVFIVRGILTPFPVVYVDDHHPEFQPHGEYPQQHHGVHTPADTGHYGNIPGLQAAVPDFRGNQVNQV